MPYKDPVKQAEAMRVIRARYNKTIKGLNCRVRYNATSGNKKRSKAFNDRRTTMRGNHAKKRFDEVLRVDQEGRCAYCHAKLRKKGGQIDRVVPGVEYSESNCVLSCAECNMQKKCHDVNDFLDDLIEEGIIPPGEWVMPGGRYHRLQGGRLKPNTQYKGSLLQHLPEHSSKE